MSNGITFIKYKSKEYFRCLKRHHLSQQDMDKALKKFTEEEEVPIGTPIGLHDVEGFVFAIEYVPELEEAVASPGDAHMNVNFQSRIGCIPWVQIYELLGRVPEGATENFLFEDKPWKGLSN